MTIGVVIVTYNASDVIIDCLESLLASEVADLRIVVVDNASGDGTCETMRTWAAGANLFSVAARNRPFVPRDHGRVAIVEGREGISRLSAGAIGLVASPDNRGFAGGVNIGLRALLAQPGIEHFWILNPDCMSEPRTAERLEQRARREGRYGIIGGRIFYAEPPDTIQSDGGRINFWTGICVPFNMTARAVDCMPPRETDLDYIAGTHMFVSRAYIETVGFMPEDYFLFYEEMDWCTRRGDLPLLFEPAAAVHHHGGHSIGSATLTQVPSPLAAYFLNRARIKFVARFRPLALPVALAYSTARALRQILRGQVTPGLHALRGLWGFPPTRPILRAIGRTRLPRPE